MDSPSSNLPRAERHIDESYVAGNLRLCYTPQSANNDGMHTLQLLLVVVVVVATNAYLIMLRVVKVLVSVLITC
jgi:hypothetical protein